MNIAIDFRYSVVLLLLSSICAVGCNPQPSLYVSNNVPMPFLCDQGDIRFAIATEGSGNGTGMIDNTTTFEGAYALTDQIGILATMMYAGMSTDTSYGKHLFGELAVGYHEKFDAYGRFEAYGGVGYGRVNNAWSSQDPLPTLSFFSPPVDTVTLSKNTQSATYLRPFIQMELGAEGEIAAIGLGLRVGYVTIAHVSEASQTIIQTHVDTSGVLQYSKGTRTADTRSVGALFLEPSLMGRIGYDPVKVSFAITLPQALGKNIPFLYSTGVISVGLSVSFQAFAKDSTQVQ